MKKTMHKEVTLMSALLCLCVIMIHLTSTPVTVLTPGSFAHAMIFSANQPLIFSVPGFIFLSGFKLYNQYGCGKLDLKRFYLRRFWKVVLPYAVSVMVYFLYFWYKGWCSLLQLPEYLLLGTLASHFYYIIIAVQFYLLFPLLTSALNRHPMITCGLSLASTITFYSFVHFTYSDRFAGTYVFFFVLGMLFARSTVQEKCVKYYRAALILMLSVGIVHFTALYHGLYGNFRYAWANTVTVLYVAIAIIAIYSTCTKLAEKEGLAFQLAQPISRVSFHVYLYHILVILFLQHEVFPHFVMVPWQQFFISFIVVYGLVFILAYGRQKQNSIP